MNNPQETFQQP